jgi:hypothetical protein
VRLELNTDMVHYKRHDCSTSFVKAKDGNDMQSNHFVAAVFFFGTNLKSIALSTDAPVRDMIGAGSPDAPFYMKFLAGAITGGVGSVIGNRKYC